MLRFLYICGVLIKYGFLFILMRLRLYHFPPDKTVKRFFEEAGGSFIKFGQLLALRVDILPKQYSLEMFDLLDNVKPFSYNDVKEIFLADLGATPEKVFKDFQSEPFASGSFGQVHAAKLDDDTIVAVKIMRPDIEETVKADFIIVDIAAFIGDTFLKISGFNWKEFASEFKRWTWQELDYQAEAENADRLREALAPNTKIVIPRIYNRFSTKRILTQEYIDGFPLTRVLRGLKDGRLTREELKELGVDLKKTPHTLCYELLYQYFIGGFFHADLHPGNIILLQNDKIGLIDFGIMGEWIPVNQISFIRFIKNVGDFNFNEAIFYFADVVSDDLKMMIQSAFPASVEQKQIDEFIRILSNHFAETVEETVKSSLKDLKEMKTDYTVMFMKILNSAESYKIKLPKEMAIFIKALSTLGLVAKEMDSEFYINKDIKHFFELNPEETIPNRYSGKTTRRMSRERAMERLNNWLSYLLERQPDIYKLVNAYITQYNRIDK
ncbi:hypothetical protein BH09PAT1_BH09PAT1_1800 [soil metagenome]